MNDIKDERKEQTVRIMAVIGFIVMIVLLAWLAVQLVRFMPTAFSSLANIFEANQRDYNDRVDGEDNVVVVEDGEDDIYVDDEDVDVVDSENTTDTATTTDSGNDYEENDDTDVVTDSTTDTGGTTATPVQYKTVVTYKTPVSDPNGFTDLVATFAAIGYVNSSGRFVPTNDIDGNERGAMQFVVKNIGTKTSGSWTFEAELPDGSTIDSNSQSPLKPQETSTLTIVFGDIDDRGHHDVGAIVIGGNDNNKTNNGFRVTVDIE